MPDQHIFIENKSFLKLKEDKENFYAKVTEIFAQKEILVFIQPLFYQEAPKDKIKIRPGQDTLAPTHKQQKIKIS